MFASTTKLNNGSKYPHFVLCSSCLWCATVFESEEINKQSHNSIINICHNNDLSLIPVAVEALQVVASQQ